MRSWKNISNMLSLSAAGGVALGAPYDVDEESAARLGGAFCFVAESVKILRLSPVCWGKFF